VLKVEIHTEEIPTIFTRFRDIIDDSHWRKRVSLIKSEMRGNPFLRDYLIEDNYIAYAFESCSELKTRYGQIPPDEIENRKLYPAISVAAQVLSIIDRSSTDQAHKLVRRIHGAFKNPDDMRAFQFELRAATHFLMRGHALIWPEMAGIGTFDLLVSDIADNGLEVECKSVSSDKGRKIHRRDALEFHHLVSRQIKSTVQNLRSGLSIVLTVPNRLPTLIGDRQALAQNVKTSILSAMGGRCGDGADIRLTNFDVAMLGGLGSDGSTVITRAAIDKVTTTRNREAMVIGNESGGAIVFVLQSAADDSLLQYAFKTASESAKTQLTKSRPALFLAGLEDLKPEALIDVAQQDSNPEQESTALRREVSNFLLNEDRGHVAGFGFLSQSVLSERSQGVVSGSSSVYFFPNKESKFWHQDFEGLFS
jgi:hypothetical protein